MNTEIQGSFERFLPRSQEAPCWKSKESTEAKDLQSTLGKITNGKFEELDQKIEDYMKQDHFFRYTEGKFYEVEPGDYKKVDLKIQVKEGTITWYFANVGHDETTQEFRNQIFRSAALGHLLVDDACAKYYRGTNAMHVKRMHTSETESMINHNHYRVQSDECVTVAQFKEHLYGFLEGQKAYGIPDKFLNKEEADKLIEEYKTFDEEMSRREPGDPTMKTKREKYHDQEKLKWSELDKEELGNNKSIEEPCEAAKMEVPLNEKQITVETKNHVKEMLLPKEWPKYLDRLDKVGLDVIAKAGSEGQKAGRAHTRQMEVSKFDTIKNPYTKLGELFEQERNRQYPAVEKKTDIV